MADYKLFTSCLWQTTSAVVSTDDRLYLFDPAYFPHEIEAIADYVQSVRDGRELVLVLTHGLGSHRGLPSLPGRQADRAQTDCVA
ncbi:MULTISPECIES: hypothetical protein [Brevibacillus]|uniref:hypothetical protein n=1 Tax=Brevibacillus TaxID=55080 RepID=UPI000271CCA0|nr:MULTISPECIES: hypothetical protein [Brevibacillus]EJL41930.1 hypothetical protein PMI08_03518 [Brevibacillus sp. CF112]MED1822577.1 hypothetical protein [Brevibacillus agri]